MKIVRNVVLGQCMLLFGIFSTINVGGIERCLWVKQKFTKHINGRSQRN